MRNLVLLVSVCLASPALAQGTSPPTITYVGVDKDVTDFQTGLPYGRAGYWFPQFDASGPRSQKPTEENERNALPPWAGPMTHMLIFELWKFPQRTFSQDGPCKSKGGIGSWNYFRLPNGEFGLSGVILDPHGNANTSQTVNRITLGPGTPPSFFLRIVVDNTDLRHNPINRIRARGEHNGAHVDPATYPSPGMAEFNGMADVYSFRYDGFGAGDFIKIQFNGMPGGTNNGGTGGSSFAGLMFDLVAASSPTPIAPSPSPTPSPAPTTPPTSGTPPPTSPSTPAPTPTPTPTPTPQATGTTAPGSTAGPGPVPASGSRSGSSCSLAAPARTRPTPPLLLLTLLGLALWGRRRATTA